MKLEIEYQSFCHFMTILNESTIMIKVFASFYIEMIPKAFNHIVISKFIMMPCRKNKMSRCMH